MCPRASEADRLENTAPLRPDLPEAAHGLPIDDLELLPHPLVARFHGLGMSTVGALARSTPAVLIELPRIGILAVANARRALDQLFADLEGLPASARRETATLRRALAVRQPLVERVRQRLKGDRSAVSVIAKRRALADGPVASLKSIAGPLGVTHQMVSVLEKRVWVRLSPLANAASALDDAIARARHGRGAPLTCRDLEGTESWLAGIQRRPGIVRGLLDHFAARHRLVRMGPSRAWIFVPASMAEPREWRLQVRAHVQAHGGRSNGLEADVASMLAREGAPELKDVVASRLTTTLEYRPTLSRAIQSVLEEAGGPLHASVIRARLTELGFDLTGVRIGSSVLRLDTVRTAPEEYVLRSHLATWDRHRDRARRAVKEILRGSRRRYWLTRELLVALRARDERWADGAAPHVIEHLLLEAPELSWLGYGTFALRARAKGDGVRARAFPASAVRGSAAASRPPKGRA